MPNRRWDTRWAVNKLQKEIPKKPKSPNKQLSDSDTSEEEQINPVLKTSVEERHYGTIPGLALATQIALSHSRAQANPTVERGPSCKVRVKKLPTLWKAIPYGLILPWQAITPHQSDYPDKFQQSLHWHQLVLL